LLRGSHHRCTSARCGPRLAGESRPTPARCAQAAYPSRPRRSQRGHSKGDLVPKSVRISVIGAGSGVFSLGLVKDLCLNENLRESEVSFMDLNQERLDIVSGLAHRYAEEFGSRLRFETTLDRQAALRDADYVVNTASARSHAAQRRERELTQEHGYYYGGTNLDAPFENFDLMLSVARD